MYLCLIFLPFINFIFSLSFGRFFLSKGTSFLCCASMFCCFFLSVLVFFEVGFCRSPVYIKILPWIDCELFDASWGLVFDSLSVSMCLMVNFISSLVHLYSTSYMSHDPHQVRFMSFLSLFTFFMLMLVTSDNFLQLFFGWEGVGLCSYLLINFWFTRLQANKSAIKAMLVNRVGDFGLALGIFAIFLSFKSIDFFVIFSLVPYYLSFDFFFFDFRVNLLVAISLLLFLGVIGKSAQIGLHTWLPDAMEGPTPVSALIHAATMVTAGVFLLIRCSPIYENSSSVLFLVAFVGATTAFFSATIGIFQNDLKKVIAYSTCSQLGYMVFSCGLSNYSVALFYVLNHAYFKALLFLSAGAIIHSLGDEQDFRKFGGLFQILPFTYSVFIIGSLALTGFPFLTGFYSKDLVLELAYSKFNFVGNFTHWLGVFSASLTAFYSFKLLYLTFLSKPNGFKILINNASESSMPMLFPLFILSFCSIFLGYLTKDLFVGFGTPFWNNAIYINPDNVNMLDAEFIPVYIKWLPFISTFLGGFCSFLFYHIFNLISLSWIFSLNFKKIYTFFNKKWFFDKLQNELILSSFLNFGFSISYKILDKGLFEFFWSFSMTSLFLNVSKSLSSIHSGYINHYAFFIFVFFLSFLLLFQSFFLDLEIYLLIISFLIFDNIRSN